MESRSTKGRKPAIGNLLLFPSCDERGWITDALSEGAGNYDEFNPENIFFAWLLELPVGMDSKKAARSLLCLAEVHQPESRFSLKIVSLLQDLVEGRPSSRAETLDDLVQQVNAKSCLSPEFVDSTDFVD